ncbi:hypothetical protein AB0M80_24060 [Amycolatopsis sp. NPDC051045]|uniref:hypothetical protein n=1 Tax=Amycolatopsis sp. NPDC051045 TaxID=3156922 RepID=UPI00343F3F80
MTLTIEGADLGKLGDQLGRGGQAVVFEAPDVHLPDVPGPLVFKEYKKPPNSGDELRKIVLQRDKLSAVDRARLDAYTTWPLRVVERAGVPCGVLMRRIPAEFGEQVKDCYTGATKWKPCEVQFLFVDPDRLGGPLVGRRVPTWEQRLTICRDFAGMLEFYHERVNAVFGDINPKNELYRLDGTPSVMFIDCDGVRLMSQGASNVQLNVDDWRPPEGGSLNRLTDRYKLGLFVRRSLLPGARASIATDPVAIAGVLDGEGVDLLTRAIAKGADPRQRPSPYEWWRYFSLLLGDVLDPPTLTQAYVDRSFVAEGLTVGLHWQATDAVTLDIVAGGRTTSIDARQGGGVVPLRLDRTTHVTVTAVNPMGVDTRVLDPVAVIPPPNVLGTPIAMPELPRVAALVDTLPRPALPQLPDVVLPERFSPLLGSTTEPGSRFDWPDFEVAGFPLDLNDLLLGGPSLVEELLTDSEETT